MKLEQIPSVQSWLLIEKILDKGIIKLKNSSYVTSDVSILTEKYIKTVCDFEIQNTDCFF